VTAAEPLPLVGRDYYTELIEGSRWLRKEQAAARTTWFERLPWEHKERTLFRFEMLLKGLVCFGNPVNHPGPPRRAEPAVAREFTNELGIVRGALGAICESGRALSGGERSTQVFQRYLESVLVQDQARMKIARNALSQDTPEQSLAVLISAIQNVLEVSEGLARAPRISYRIFSAVIRLAQREIHRSEYFDPLAALEFRAEFDRIRTVEILDVIRGIRSDPARRVAALSFLALFRLLRYVDLVSRERAEGGGFGTLFSFLALLRSDARALSIFFRRDAATWLAGGFGKQYERLSASNVASRFGSLSEEFEQLKSLRELLGSLGNQLALEQRRVYEQQIPALADVESREELAEATVRAAASLEGFLQNSVVTLATEFDPDISGERVFAEFTSAKTRSERLRRDIWMFQQIVRAFVVKTKGSMDAADHWSGLNTFRFVREFVRYFKSMGYQLLRYSDYERFDTFMDLITRLGNADVLEVERLGQVVSACEDFHEFLGRMFEAVGRREELADIPFDRKDAARTLMLFLGR